MPPQEVVQPNKFRSQAINGCVSDLDCNSDKKQYCLKEYMELEKLNEGVRNIYY